MDQDDLGSFKLEVNGTLLSLDQNNTVIHSKQLTAEEFYSWTGCEIAAPGSASEAETEQCFQQKTAAASQPGGVSPTKCDGKIFERQYACEVFICQTHYYCMTLTLSRCVCCLFLTQYAGICF